MEEFNKKLLYLIKRYKNAPIAFDFRKFCSPYKWAKRSDVFTHHLHKYPAKLLPHIPIFFLSSEICMPKETVLDPFAGSGTVLLESLTHPCNGRNCIGVEVNPLGRLIAKVKTTLLKENTFKRRKNQLYELLDDESISPVIPDYKNLSLWFSDPAQIQLGRIRACIEKLRNDDYKDFFYACYSSIIRRVSLADPNIPPPVVLKLSKYKRSKGKYEQMKRFLERNKNPDGISLFKDSIENNWRRVSSLNTLDNIVFGKLKTRIVWDDSRNLMKSDLSNKGYLRKRKAVKFRSNSIGLIITSPPYITAQKYVRTTKFELLWLGMLETDEINELDKTIIGTEKISLRDDIEETGIVAIDVLCKKIKEVSIERALMTNRYFLDMKKVLKNMFRVLKKNRKAVMIVGDNKVCGHEVKTHELLAQIGQHMGFELDLIMKDKIRSRGMITSRHKNGGLIENEYVVVLSKN
jgi:DNA modification methylase